MCKLCYILSNICEGIDILSVIRSTKNFCQPLIGLLIASKQNIPDDIKVIGTVLYERYRRFYCRLCTTCGLGHWWFVLCLGILGTVVAVIDILDIFHINQRGPLLTESIWRSRLHRGSQRLVSPEAERDMKLMVTILSVEHYLLMIFGVLQANPALLMPWLMMEAIIIALEAVFFGMRLCVEGFCLNRCEVIMSAIVLHNWFQVFCFFRKYLSMCDL